MGQTFSEYLYYDSNTGEIKDDIFFSEDCLITSVSTPKEFISDLESIPEEEELIFEEPNLDTDAHSKDYVKNIFLLAKNELDKGEVNKKQNFDILYPIKLTEIDKSGKYLNEYLKIKEQHKNLQWDHDILQRKYDTLKHSFDVLSKNYESLKRVNKKYKFD